MKKEVKKKLQKATIASITSASVLTASLVEDPKVIANLDDDKNRAIYITKDSEKSFYHFTEKIPLWIRIFFLVPMWLLGTSLLKIFAPFKSFFLNFIITFLILIILYCIVAKLLFKDLKLKDILNKRSIKILFIGSFLIGITNKVLMIVSEDYRKFMSILDFVLGLLTLVICLYPLIQIKKKLDGILMH